MIKFFFRYIWCYVDTTYVVFHLKYVGKICSVQKCVFCWSTHWHVRNIARRKILFVRDVSMLTKYCPRCEPLARRQESASMLRLTNHWFGHPLHSIRWNLIIIMMVIKRIVIMIVIMIVMMIMIILMIMVMMIQYNNFV